MKERALLLGPLSSMLAIVSEPDAALASRPTVLVLNAGIVHRVGAHRKSVNLARALCAGGFRVVRFDLSGIGDSPARKDALGFADSALADLGEIMDDLSARQLAGSGFVLMGLCSGADNSFEMAVRDPRVVGAILLDGVAYRTPRFYFHKFGPRIKRKSAWITAGKQAVDLARREVAKRLGQPLEEPAAEAPKGDAVRDFAPKEETTAKLQQLCNRGVKTYWLYTAGAPSYYNHREQFFDCFAEVDFRGTVTHDYFAESNHTFTELRTQRKLIGAVTAWAERTFPAG